MALERTFAIIKPDAVSRGQQGEILARIHKAGFKIIAIKSMRLTKEEAGGFYAVHKARPFFGELTDFMSSGKILAMVLEAEGAILKWRDAMGATDPKKARSHSPPAWRPSCPHRRFFLLWQQTALPLWPPSWRHRPSRRTHHLLFSNRHLSRTQHRGLSPLLVLLSFPPLNASPHG